ncbi:Metalloendopeptidase [Aphelenchoides besseyi]|nr:Metalloendopeptidase [Aphelenchoides besseyi]
MHALGVEHEHQRPDRDNYITVRYENVEAGRHSNFEKLSKKYITTKGLSYDYNSIMHYDSRAFGRHVNNVKMETMVPKRAGVYLGKNEHLTGSDLKKLRILGKCPNYGKSQKQRKGRGKKRTNKKKKRH